jgi:opacity protein-like surface antigen
MMVAASVILTPAAFAAVSDEEIAALREQLAAVAIRLDQLEAENAELRAAQIQVDTEVSEVKTQVADIPASGSGWEDRVSLGGDFRYRYERIDAEGSDTRRRNRIRARANIEAQLDDRTEVGFGLATGGDDPVSTNQTLGAGGSSKNIALNR